MDKEKKIELLVILKNRFEKNMHRHVGIKWDDVIGKLEMNPEKLNSLLQMETTGGEPDVLEYDNNTKHYIFTDFSKESPNGRRSLCYDKKALDARKQNKPTGDAITMAEEMGTKILTEELYRKMQEVEEFDLKTSSWVKTPADIRNLGGAIFCDRRYNTVFTYHNGADSYYGARGFRTYLKV
ncbi:MAG: DUF4256 domain-containing protein [Bacilli bacterium]|nr:DUF4256 domain-containing protein [Bacilli bacterium]